MTVYKSIAHGPVLGHIDKRAIDRRVTVRVIFTHGITDDTRTLTVGLVGTIIQLDHGVKNSSLYRFQTVSDIRKGTGSNNAHRIIDVEGLHTFLQIDFLNLIKDPALIIHLKIPPPYHQMSRFLTYFAFFSMNSLLGSTLSPMRTLNVSSILSF